MDNFIQKIYKGFKPLCWCKSKLVLYKKSRIYITDLESKPKKICLLKRNIIDFLLSKSKLASRLLRLDPRAAIAIDEKQIILSLKGYIYRVDITNGHQAIEHAFRKNMNNPLGFSKISDIEGFQDTIVYGEYWGNPQKEAVAIYGRNQFGTWKKLYEFPKETVCHIHNIIPDRYRNVVLILTGDSDQESGIWKATNNFNEVVPLLVGKQLYRSCCLYPMKNEILYATDTPLEQNYILKIKLKNEKANYYEIEEVCKIDGPSIFSTTYNGRIVFSTSVESNPNIKSSRIGRFLNNTRGPGVKSNYSKLIKGDAINGFIEIAKFEKDSFPMIFQFGNIYFPTRDGENQLVIFPYCVKKYGGDTLVINPCF